MIDQVLYTYQSTHTFTRDLVFIRKGLNSRAQLQRNVFFFFMCTRLSGTIYRWVGRNSISILECDRNSWNTDVTHLHHDTLTDKKNVHITWI